MARKKILDKFIRIARSIYFICFIFSFILLFMSLLLSLPLNWLIKFFVTTDILLVLVSIIYCCISDFVVRRKIADSILIKQERINAIYVNENNSTMVFVMMVASIFFSSLCDGVNYSIRLLTICGTLTAILFVFELVSLKKLKADEKKLEYCKILIEVICVLALLMANYFYVQSSIVYVNSNYGVEHVKTFVTEVNDSNYEMIHTPKVGTDYYLYVVDPGSRKKYKLTIDQTEYDCRANKDYNIKVDVYKGIFGLEWARKAQ